MRRAAAAVGLAALLTAACAGPAPLGEAWSAPVAADHPLVGTVVDTRTGAPTTPDAVAARLAAAHFVLLGEKHDNPDHHRLQAWVVERLAAAGRRPAVVFEMLDSGQREALAHHLRERPDDALGIGAAVGFEEAWGPWAPYEPIAAAALAAGLPLVAGNLSPDELRRASAPPGPGRDAALRRRLGLDFPYPEGARAELARQIQEGHCGLAPADAIATMIDAQRARDAALAAALLDAGTGGAVLIAGTGHTRADLGVPWVLRARGSTASLASVAFVEVPLDATTLPEALDALADVGPHDFLWFTPRVDDLDPCQRFREQLEGIQAPH